MTLQASAAGPHLPGLHWLDWVVIAGYMVGMLAIGWFFSRTTKTKDDYLLGGRNMRSGPVGLSLFASLFSAITYLAIPGEMINKGPAILAWMISIPVIYLVVGYVFIPHFMRIKVTSAYQILESRLGLRVRLLASIIFLVTRLVWMALIIYVIVDKLLVPVTGWGPKASPYLTVAVGLITVVYTSMGGLRAVVLTDVIQSVILFGAAVVAILLITMSMGGVSAWWPEHWSPNWDAQPFFSLDPTVRATVLGSLAFMGLWWICTAASDQMAIQRYLATRDARTARRVFLITVISNVVITLVLACLGFALLGFFQAHPDYLPSSLTLERDGDKLFPYYIVQFLPPAATGLVIAGLLAAAMSSLSAGINSSCAVVSADFIERFQAPGHTSSPQSQVRQTKIIAVASGLVAVLLSSLMSKVTGNIMEVTVRTNHVFIAPLFGLFFMALFVPFATGFGASCGAIAGAGVAVVIAYWDILTGGPALSFQWITVLSLIADLAVGCIVSLAIPIGRNASPLPVRE
jgi:solute:Na+ symporter, SSS family